MLVQFTIFWVDGISLLEEVLTTRRERPLPTIKEVNTDIVPFSDHFESDTALFEEMKKLSWKELWQRKKKANLLRAKKVRNG